MYFLNSEPQRVSLRETPSVFGLVGVRLKVAPRLVAYVKLIIIIEKSYCQGDFKSPCQLVIRLLISNITKTIDFEFNTHLHLQYPLNDWCELL